MLRFDVQYCDPKDLKVSFENNISILRISKVDVIETHHTVESISSGPNKKQKCTVNNEDLFKLYDKVLVIFYLFS